MKTVAEATNDLWSYINSLSEEQRVKAAAYQKRLESEAEVHKDGMSGVILDHLKHNNMLLIETATEFMEDLADTIATSVIGKCK